MAVDIATGHNVKPNATASSGRFDASSFVHPAAASTCGPIGGHNTRTRDTFRFDFLRSCDEDDVADLMVW